MAGRPNLQPNSSSPEPQASRTNPRLLQPGPMLCQAQRLPKMESLDQAGMLESLEDKVPTNKVTQKWLSPTPLWC